MPIIGTIACTVESPTQPYRFKAEIHMSTRPSEQRIDANFYETQGPGVPQGVHHEFMLIESPVVGRVNPNVAIHVYTHKETGERFVCYTMPIGTREHAEEFFRWWCVGTVYSIEQDEDFGVQIGQHPDDFLEFMDREFGIRLVE